MLKWIVFIGILMLSLWEISLLLLYISSWVSLGLATLKWKDQPTKQESDGKRLVSRLLYAL